MFQTRTVTAIALSLMLVTLWSLTHRYHGFARDGELYAVQALSRIQPELRTDLYLKNTSQDDYTIFSPLYAALIRAFGLQTAELVLFALCTAGFLTAAWLLARNLFGADLAWLAAALLIITVGYYGAYLIFSFSENYLTARSLGEALVVTALLCHFLGRRVLALLIAAGALAVHPLMVLPGLLLLICLWLPLRLAGAGAAAGVLLVGALALTAAVAPSWVPWLTVMDPEWLDVVRERSQFLFMQCWTSTDWEIAARPFVCLTLTALAIDDPRLRKLCAAAMLVGVAGLAVSAIAGAGAPVAALLQGQAWRWMWITSFVSVLLLVPTAFRVWQDARCGPLCALLLALSWTYPAVDGLATAAAALLLWLLRAHIPERSARLLKWAAGAIGVVLLGWMLASCWTIAGSPIPESGRESLFAGRLRAVFDMGAPALLLAGLAWIGIRRIRSPWVAVTVATSFLAAIVAVLPGSLKQLESVGTRAEIEEFADWRRAIPPTSSVLIVPARKSAAFDWFTLGRPSYLTIDQSAGVVFSPVTAAEVRRRADVLLPLLRPDWQILTHIAEKERNKHRPGSTLAPESESQPLTAPILVHICADPQLGFVVAKENLAFDPLKHRHAGGWKDWNLYDCRRVRASTPAA
jgi:hypothetical protein